MLNETTYQERMAELIQSIDADIEYALRQLAAAKASCTKATIVFDCAQRATDALLRAKEKLRTDGRN